MVNITKRFGKEIRNAQRARKPVTELLALMWMVGCGEVFTGIPDLDAPDGRMFEQHYGDCHGASYRGGHGVPDPRFRTMAEWQALLPIMDSLIREKGLPPLTEPERETIIRYLNRHANS